MPRKRATKAQNKRAKPKLKDDDGDDGMSAIQREAKRNGYLEDCDVTGNLGLDNPDPLPNNARF